MRLARALFHQAPLATSAALLLGLLGGSSYAIALWWIDGVVHQPQGTHADVSTLFIVSIAIVALLQYLATTESARILLSRLRDLRLRLVKTVITSPLRQLDLLGSQALVSSLVDDTQKVAQGVWAVPAALLHGGVCIAAYVFIGLLSPTSLVLLLTSQVLLFGGLGLLMTHFCHLTDRAAVDRQRVLDIYQFLGNQVHLLKQSATLRRAYVEELVEPSFVHSERSSFGVSRSAALMDALAKAGFLFIIAILVVGGVGPLAPEPVARLPVLMAFMYVAAPFSALLGSAQVLSEAERAWRRLDALDLGAEPADVGISLPPSEIELSAASYTYGDGTVGENLAVSAVNLRWSRGRITLICGGNGAGKTTVARMACGLLAPTVGELRCDGVRVASTDLMVLRQHVAASWSEQSPSMLWFNPTEQSRCQDWWNRLGLNQTHAFRPGWVDVRAMSSGQRERASLVALLGLRTPFLVLDEWAAHQDQRSRSLFYDEMLPMLREEGTGVLIIAHDVEATLVADGIVHLERPPVLSVIPSDISQRAGA